MLKNKATSVLTNFGCKYTCNYCPASAVPYRERENSHILNEIRDLKKNGIDNIWIRDFTFGLNKEKTKSLLGEMIKLDISWFCLSRAETLDDEMINLMSKSGCYLVMIGTDSISKNTMKNISRIQNKNLLQKRIKYLDQCNIQVLVHMILGLPEEKFWEAVETIHFLSKTKASFLSINFFSPRAGSKYFQEEFINNLDELTLDSKYPYFEEANKRIWVVVLKYYALIYFYGNPFRVIRILKKMKSKRQMRLIFNTGLKQFFPSKKKYKNI